MDTLVWRYSL